MAPFSTQEKKIILRFVDYFALLTNEFRCGYAHSQGAAQAFSEHPKNRKTIENFCQKFIFLSETSKKSVK